MTEAPILARADGYLKTPAVDIGDRVRAGQPLAEIDAPELDQQIHQAEAAIEQAQASLEQAQASLEQGKANRELARVTAERWKTLAAQGIVSQQENDQYQAQLIVAERQRAGARKGDLGAAQQRGGQPGEPRASPGGPGLPRREGSVRRRDHGAQCGCRRAGEHRQHAAVPNRANRDASHVRERSAGQRQFDPRRPAGPLTLSNFPGPAFPRHGRAHGERARSVQPHDAGRSRRAERRRRAVPRHVCRSRLEQRASESCPVWFRPRL